MHDQTGLQRALRKAHRVEEALRSIAFLPVLESIGPASASWAFPARQLTLQHISLLILSGSPYFVGGTVRVEHVAQLLWCVSPGYNARGLGKGDFLRRFWDVTHPRGDFNGRAIERIHRAINRYIDRAQIDRPPIMEGGSGKQLDVSLLAAYVDELAAAYSWQDDAIVQLPIARVYQYLRRIRDRRNRDGGGAGVPAFNPLQDRLRAVYLDARNRAA